MRISVYHVIWLQTLYFNLNIRYTVYQISGPLFLKGETSDRYNRITLKVINVDV
jgi:hypothetical protein